jgi:hypothetical protein
MVIALRLLAVTKIIRDGIAIAAPRMSQRLGQPARQWHPMLIALVLAISSAVLVAQMHIMISWRVSHQRPAPVEGQDRPVLQAMLVRIVVQVADILLSCLWFARVPAPPDPEEEEAGGPPKPLVTSFVVRDATLECGDQVCAICLEELSTGCLAGRLPCGHIFHDDCCRTWLQKGHRQARCPMRCSFAPSSPRGESLSENGASAIGRATGLESTQRSLEDVSPAVGGAIDPDRSEVRSTSWAASSIAEAV